MRSNEGGPKPGPRAAAVGEQLALVRAAAAGALARPAPVGPKVPDPVAVVAVDIPLPHLDRPFEYSVPAALAADAQPGVRVKVGFAGRDVDGFVLRRAARAEHEGSLAPLRRVVSPEPVLTPAVLAIAQATARHYAGTLGDVLRLAVPPRHARAEKALPSEPAAGETDRPQGLLEAWRDYPAGASFLGRVRAGEHPAASWLAAPDAGSGTGWPAALAAAVEATLSGGRGALVVLPDHRDVDRLDAALRNALGAGRHVRLSADQGPQARYTAFLKVLRGHVRAVVGTRAAMFAPVRDLGLVAWWDDGDDLLVEPRAPYPHTGQVLAMRAELEGAALLSGGYTRTTTVQRWVEDGRAHPLAPDPRGRRARTPTVRLAGEDTERERDPGATRAQLPSLAWRTAKNALESGPVLVQVPRRGYVRSLSCQTCRMPARCNRCQGPLAQAAPGGPPTCRWCGLVVSTFACPHCEGRTVRSGVLGSRRTAQDLGRAFPGVPLHTSGAGQVLETVPATPSVVVATPGAEPVAPDDGYAAVLLLDAWASLDRPTLDAGEEALRRWIAAAALARSGPDGGTVVLCGLPDNVSVPAAEALVRWDPAWFAARELAERRELRLPPAARMATVTGARAELRTVAGALEEHEFLELIGPVPAPPTPRRERQPDERRLPDGSSSPPNPIAQQPQRLLVRTDLAHATDLARALKEVRAVRSARKASEILQVRLDPDETLA